MNEQDIEKIFQLAVEKAGDENLKKELAAEGASIAALPVSGMQGDDAPGDAEEKALAVLIKDMNVAQRIKLAMFGNQTARTILLRDTNRLVPLYVLDNPRITDNEIVEIARNTNVDDSILRAVGNNLQWMKAYQVKINLVSNAKTPIDVAMRWLKYITEKDLGRLAKSKNVPQVVANQAKKLLEKREK